MFFVHLLSDEQVTVELEKNDMTTAEMIVYLFEQRIEKTLIKPTFVLDYPKELTPLAKEKPDNPNVVERFELYINGIELANAYSELNDPIDQRKRFEEQQRLREKGDEEAQMYDKDFVEALEYGMPPTAGFGMSERFFAFLMDKPLRECVFFPLMRRKDD